ncbi:transferrin-binding protein-like solute binding protein [Magnetospirillum fulvum]|uniref:FecR family protein n=1 Tax=Magnetospirillum fulvum TaxID=1082 RepID=A0A1H6HEH2_MAGFU|nr:transferrin-binding protein-like solute binding protein [Magnetospirillum fulvum]SEH34171.1 FecR family protein [Magnetospirillum fulvum]
MRQASYSVTAALASVLALSGPVAAAEPESEGALIGNAGGLTGSVLLASAAVAPDRRAVGRQIGSGDPIYQGDQIVTGPGGRVQLMLLDQTIITLGENARMTVDEISFGPTAADGKISVGVEQGAFRFISGQVAQARPENVNIRVPMGNIGIRGTIVGGIVSPGAILVALLGPGSQTNSASAHGAIAVSTPLGTVDITRTGYGTTLLLGQPPSPPTVLTPAQIQLLTAPPALSTALPPTPAPPSSGGGSVVWGTPETPLTTGGGEFSAGELSGQAGAVGLLFANVVSSSENSLAPFMTMNLVGTSAVAQVNQVAARTLDDSVGTALPYTFGTNYQTLRDVAYATGTDTAHSYSLLTSDPGAKSFAYTSSGVRLTSFDSNPVSLSSVFHDFGTNIRTYYGSGDRRFYDYRSVAGLIYSAYGYFVDSHSSDFNTTYAYTAIGTGIPTPSVQMPSSGSATYSGGTVGYVAIGTGTSAVAGSFAGSASLTANFSAGSISGTLSGLTTSLSGVTMGNISLSNGSISGTAFSGGTATGSITRSAVTTTSTGSFAGGFNGANAAEVAGTYAMNNSADSYHGSMPVSLVGSFGAKK